MSTSCLLETPISSYGFRYSLNTLIISCALAIMKLHALCCWKPCSQSIFISLFPQPPWSCSNNHSPVTSMVWFTFKVHFQLWSQGEIKKLSAPLMDYQTILYFSSKLRILEDMYGSLFPINASLHLGSYERPRANPLALVIKRLWPTNDKKKCILWGMRVHQIKGQNESWSSWTSFWIMVTANLIENPLCIVLFHTSWSSFFSPWVTSKAIFFLRLSLG